MDDDKHRSCVMYQAPTTGFKIPRIARTIAKKFSAMEKVRLHLIVNIIFFDRAIRCGSSRMSSFTRAISAASTAISLPIPPIAIPTKAFFRDGGIVDSIPDHADREMLLLGVFDPGKFFFRQAVRVNLIDVQKRTNVCGGIFVISGEKNRGDYP